ncbi:heparan-alpha-glucosaminide N-acetyltransferase domain-containing protein [Brevibacterium album]|uniref:heparan-alpha-glucosaminide N-acetyltransferase domain-containing protein n=1 Tax=Brevibacterium album TaxID=417948 RepID=UPI00040D7AAE|nr:heparan-alpha-glucosaminide N-acetyltransferase domain-containing protein [Brevibacterium album]
MSTAPTSRLTSLDTVRGFAVVAMVIAHTSPFVLPAPRLVEYAESMLNDVAAPLFALVIGATIALTGPAPEAAPPERTRYRLQTAGRAAVLIVLSLLLSLRFSGVVIVLEHLGLALLLALPFLCLRTRALLLWAAPLLVIGPGIVTALRLAALSHPALTAPANPLTWLLDRLVLGNSYQALAFLPLYLGGIVLGRCVLRKPRRALALLIAAVVWFVPVELWRLLDMPGTGLRGGYVEVLREAPLALGAFAFFVWVTTAASARAVLSPLTAQGRMALSVYVLHVLILMGVYTARTAAVGTEQAAWFAPPLGWSIQAGLVLVCWAFAAAWWRGLGTGPMERLTGVAAGRHPVRALWAVRR